ncbi:hypothetical protein [Streptomyces sp. NPDC097981]
MTGALTLTFSGDYAYGPDESRPASLRTAVPGAVAPLAVIRESAA